MAEPAGVGNGHNRGWRTGLACMLVVLLVVAVACDHDEDLPTVDASFKRDACKALNHQAVGNVAQQAVSNLIEAVSRQRIKGDVLGPLLTQVATSTCSTWINHVDSLLPQLEP